MSLIMSALLCATIVPSSVYATTATEDQAIECESTSDITTLAEFVGENWEDDYYTTAVIDTNTNTVTVDGEKTEANDFVDGLDDALDSVAEVKELLSDDAGIYEIEKVEDGTVTVSSPYQSKRIVVFTDTLTSDYGAEASIYDESIGAYYLRFDSEEATKNAYEALEPEFGDDVFVDEIMTLDNLDSTANFTNYGISAQGLTKIVDGDWDTDITVAVVDTGCDTSNPVFDGRISDLSYDFESKTTTVNTDTQGHGTHVAGIIASATPDNVQLMILDTQTSSGTSSALSSLLAVNYALENGADLINCSWGSSNNTTYLDKMIAKSVEQGSWLVCALGNDQQDVDNPTTDLSTYPATHADTIAVTALTQANTFASTYSNYGTCADFAGPGSNVVSAAIGGGTVTMTGTSMATPNVVAALACIKSVMPNLSRSELYDTAVKYCTDYGDTGKDKYYGWGKITLTNLISDKTPAHLEVTGNLSKTVYAESETVADLSGLSFTITRNDGSTADVTDQISARLSDDAIIVSYTDPTGWEWEDTLTGITIIKNLSNNGYFSLPKYFFAYTGAEITPAPVVKCAGKTLVANKDYTVKYEDNTNAGTATVTITGMGAYTGTLTGTYTITENEISELTATLGYSTVAYREGEMKPSVKVLFESGLELNSNYYDVEYKDNDKVGEATVIVTGKNGYTGSQTLNFNIQAAESKQLSETKGQTTVELEYDTTTFDGTEKTPKVTLTQNGEAIDSKYYTVTYEDNLHVGTATVTVQGKNGYEGTFVTNFRITNATLNDLEDNTVVVNRVYSAAAQTVQVELINEGAELVSGTDYTISYKANTNVGTTTATVVGKGDYTGTLTYQYDITALNIDECDIELQYTTKTYTGKALEPKVTVKYNGTKFKSNNYTVSYKDNKEKGTATVTITGKNNLTGTVTKTFVIK
jgi:subtilisin family serine protease